MSYLIVVRFNLRMIYYFLSLTLQPRILKTVNASIMNAELLEGGNWPRLTIKLFWGCM